PGQRGPARSHPHRHLRRRERRPRPDGPGAALRRDHVTRPHDRAGGDRVRLRLPRLRRGEIRHRRRPADRRRLPARRLTAARTHRTASPSGRPAMTYLVTGATGFIGSYVVERLLRDGHAVIALDRRPEWAHEPAAPDP